MRPEFLEPLEQVDALIGALLDQVLILEDLEVADGGGSGDRVTTECQQVTERQRFLILEDLEDRVAHDCGSHRRVAGREALGDGHDVRGDALVLDREHLAGATEAVDDFVGDQEDAVLVADFAKHLPVDLDPEHERPAAVEIGSPITAATVSGLWVIDFVARRTGRP